MRFFLLLIALPFAARAGVVEAPAMAAPAALAGASALGAAAVSFDGVGPLRPWLEVAGTPFLRVGASLIDTRAPGAQELVKSLASPVEAPVLGIFETRGPRVLNSFAMGSFGVQGHTDAVPPGRDKKDLGGYVLSMKPDGSVRFWGSGGVPATVTPAVERAVLRHVGVSPAEPSRLERLRRLWLRVLDWAAAFGKS